MRMPFFSPLLHLVLFLHPTLPLPAAPADTKDAAAIDAVLKDYVEAVRTYDAKRLDTLLDPDYIEVSPAGEVDLRPKVLSFYTFPVGKKPESPESITLDGTVTRMPAKPAAVVIARETVTLKQGEKTVTVAFRATFVLHRTKSVWQLYSSQFVAIRPPANSKP